MNYIHCGRTPALVCTFTETHILINKLQFCIISEELLENTHLVPMEKNYWNVNRIANTNQVDATNK